jgi:hypothetical protein
MIEPRSFIDVPNGDGKLQPFTSAQIRATLKAHAGTQIEIRIKRHKATRSERANRYLWGVVYKLLAKENEQTAEEFHDAMCAMFLPDERKRVEFFNKLTGECLTVEIDPRRSSKLKGDEFYDFVERVRLWGLEFLGVVTPDPDPEWWRKREAKAA